MLADGRRGGVGEPEDVAFNMDNFDRTARKPKSGYQPCPTIFRCAELNGIRIPSHPVAIHSNELSLRSDSLTLLS